MIDLYNVFKKLISNELGHHNYRRYFLFVKKNLEYRVIDRHTLFHDMYDKLKVKDIKVIKTMEERLNETLVTALKINRNYLFVCLFYLGSVLFLRFKDIRIDIAIISFILISIPFILKTYEFLINKYCYIDAQIIIIYKVVLDKILSNKSKALVK